MLPAGARTLAIMSPGLRRREIDRDGIRLSYLDNDADGPVVVVLHGLAGTGDEFTATAEADAAAEWSEALRAALVDAAG